MLKVSKIFTIVIVLFTQLPAIAQNNTNSPYTRYGYGELADRSFGAGRAMGGIGFGLRSSKQINPMNPASYTSMDTLTFLMDFGVSGQLSWYSDGVNKENNINGNLEYIAMQFPITRRLVASVGLLPFSYVGYKFGTVNEATNSYDSFSGTGGLTDVYGGLAFEIWKKRLSIGANFGFLFGNIEHNRSSGFFSNEDGTSTAKSSAKIEQIQVRDLKMDFGLQYTHPVSANESFTLGLAYTPSNNLNVKAYDISQTYTASGSVEESVTDTLSSAGFGIPNSFGVGLSYTKQEKLMLGVDFLYEDWSNARFFDKKDNFKNRMRIALGGEYTPNSMSKLFFNRVRYRAGAHYSNGYQQIKKNEASYNEYGLSIGLGLPLVDNRSYLNISFEYTKLHPEKRAMVDEQYFRFTVNYTFNEKWFQKLKIK